MSNSRGFDTRPRRDPPPVTPYLSARRIVISGGPHDGTRWSYPWPWPNSIVLLEKSTLAYHEYVRVGTSKTYTHVGCIGLLPSWLREVG